MGTSKERILVVESDPEVSDLIARQSLKPLGYRVKIATGASQAIQQAVSFSPDVVIANVQLPGLSGKDLLVALSSQGLEVPVIVMGEEGKEEDVIQAFRLGASDYLKWPIREAEVVSAVERALTQVRARRERQLLAEKLRQANKELKNRVRDLSIMINIGQAVTSITDQKALFNRIVDGAVYAAEADKGWLHIRSEGKKKRFLLSACKNLPRSIVSKTGKPWDDGISSLVALSGETLSIHGKPLNRFKVAQLGHAALVVPIKAQREVIGVLVVMREAAKPFRASNEAMLEAIADYASISLVNARLFRAVDTKARSLQQEASASQQSHAFKVNILRNVTPRLQEPLQAVDQRLVGLLTGGENFSDDQKETLEQIRTDVKVMGRVVDALSQLEQISTPYDFVTANLVDLARGAISRFDEAAEDQSIHWNQDLPSAPVFVRLDVKRIGQVFDVLLSNAIHFSEFGGEVAVRVDQNDNGEVQVSIQDSGPGIPEVQREKLFDPFYHHDEASTGVGVGLTLAKEIVHAHGGDIWIDDQAENGAIFRFKLPKPESQEQS
jgi:signal transduction histidine kinase/DNA-binding response OmpR family regulator